MCVYKQSYETDRQIFWDYIKEIHQECSGVVNEDCSMLGHERVGIDWDETNECVANSFSTKDKS